MVVVKVHECVQKVVSDGSSGSYWVLGAKQNGVVTLWSIIECEEETKRPAEVVLNSCLYPGLSVLAIVGDVEVSTAKYSLQYDNSKVIAKSLDGSETITCDIFIGLVTDSGEYAVVRTNVSLDLDAPNQQINWMVTGNNFTDLLHVIIDDNDTLVPASKSYILNEKPIPKPSDGTIGTGALVRNIRLRWDTSQFPQPTGCSGVGNLEEIVHLRIDAVAIVPSSSSLGVAVEKLLPAFKKLLETKIFEIRVVWPSDYLPIPMLSVCLQEDRERVHKACSLPLVPLLKPECGVVFKQNARFDWLATDPHKWVLENEHFDKDKFACVKGSFYYYHYNQENFDDAGWGCAYRSLQLVQSWFLLQSYTNLAVLTIPEIQEKLKRIDLAHEDLKVGSQTWIGTVECMYVLQNLFDADSTIVHAHSSEEVVELAPKLFDHLKQIGTPIVVGAGNWAYTIAAVKFLKNNDVSFLIVDPHYVGQNNRDSIVPKWVGWKPAKFIIDAAKGTFVNFCLPHLPSDPADPLKYV